MYCQHTPVKLSVARAVSQANLQMGPENSHPHLKLSQLHHMPMHLHGPEFCTQPYKCYSFKLHKKSLPDPTTGNHTQWQSTRSKFRLECQKIH